MTQSGQTVGCLHIYGLELMISTANTRGPVMRISLIVLILLSGTANAEVFRCMSMTIYSQTMIPSVIAKINEDRKTGEIEIAGTTHQTRYKLEESHHRWDWGDGKNDNFRFMFAIMSDDSAVFMDYGPNAEHNGPGQHFDCKQVS
jgi:hypothetical protein